MSNPEDLPTVPGGVLGGDPGEAALYGARLETVDDDAPTIAVCAAILLAPGGVSKMRTRRHQIEAVTAARALLELAQEPPPTEDDDHDERSKTT